MSGADLQNLVNQAAVKASRESSTHVKLSVSDRGRYKGFGSRLTHAGEIAL